MSGSQVSRVTAVVLFSALLAACGGGTGVTPVATAGGSSLSQMVAANSKIGLIALFSFNGTLNDSGPHHLKAKDSGLPVYVAGAPFGGKAIQFDGTGNAIVTAPINITPLARPKLTMGGWFKATQLATGVYGVVSNDDGNWDRSLAVSNAGRSQSYDYWSAYIGGQAIGTVPVRPGKWVFMAVAYDQSSGSGTYVFYVHHGNRLTVLKGAANFDIDSISTAVTIGKDPDWDSPFAGQAANVFFYNGILTKTQITAIIKHGPKAIP